MLRRLGARSPMDRRSLANPVPLPSCFNPLAFDPIPTDVKPTNGPAIHRGFHTDYSTRFRLYFCLLREWFLAGNEPNTHFRFFDSTLFLNLLADNKGFTWGELPFDKFGVTIVRDPDLDFLCPKKLSVVYPNMPITQSLTVIRLLIG